VTVRFVHCEFCQRLGDFQTMNMCPLCRKVICRACKHDGVLQSGRCAKRVACEGKEGAPGQK